MLLAGTAALQAQGLGTGFTYQGHLSDGAGAANGSYDFRFGLFSDPVDPAAQVGPTITNRTVPVVSGSFTTLLDFGPGVFTGQAYWLQLAVRTNGASEFTTLTNRQAITPVPTALYASQAQAVDGLRIAGGYAGNPNVVLGSSANFITGSTFLGATIGGGGDFDAPNGIGPNGVFGTISGGAINYVNNNSGTIGGGQYNVVSGLAATVPGGANNTAAGAYSVATGQRAKANHDATFVFADGQAADFVTTASNQFLIRVAGGVGINTNSPQTALHVRGTITATASDNGAAVAGTALPGGNVGVQGIVGTNASPTVRYNYLDTGVYGESTDFGGNGVVGVANSGAEAYAIWGISQSGFAGRFEGQLLVIGPATVDGNTVDNGNLTVNGMLGVTNANFYGTAISGTGLDARSIGVQGMVGATFGHSTLFTNTGVYGESGLPGGNGVVGIANGVGSYGVWGLSGLVNGGYGYAGRFDGNVGVNGTLTATTLVGNGAGLSGVNAAQLGGLPASAFALSGQAGGTFSGNGAGLTNVNAASVGGLSAGALVQKSGDSMTGSLEVVSHQNFGVSGQSLQSGGIGVIGIGNSGGVGIFGESTNGFAGEFYGTVLMNGTNLVNGNTIDTGSVTVNGPSFLHGSVAVTGASTLTGNTRIIGSPALSSIALQVQSDASSGVALLANATSTASAEAIRGVVGGSDDPSGFKNAGVYGESLSPDGNGVVGVANQGGQAYGVYGLSANGYAGYFDGQLAVTGASTLNRLAVGGDETIAGALGVGGIATVASLTVQGDETVSGTSTVNGVLTASHGIVSDFYTSSFGTQMTLGNELRVDLSSSFYMLYNFDGFIVRSTGNNETYMYYNNDGDFEVTGNMFEHGSYVISDRTRKENFAEVSSRDVLAKVVALPITRWNYKDETGMKHVGPMAQDFYAAFRVGPSDKVVSLLDEGGVALAAIQGLNQKLEETRAENAALKERLDRLERLLEERTAR